MPDQVNKAINLTNQALDLENEGKSSHNQPHPHYHKGHFERAADLYTEAINILEQQNTEGNPNAKLLTIQVQMYRQKRDYLTQKAKQPA